MSENRWQVDATNTVIASQFLKGKDVFLFSSNFKTEKIEAYLYGSSYTWRCYFSSPSIEGDETNLANVILWREKENLGINSNKFTMVAMKGFDKGNYNAEYKGVSNGFLLIDYSGPRNHSNYLLVTFQ